MSLLESKLRFYTTSVLEGRKVCLLDDVEKLDKRRKYYTLLVIDYLIDHKEKEADEIKKKLSKDLQMTWDEIEKRRKNEINRML